MAALQGHITNSRGNKHSATAHQQMEAMVRTWSGGITLTIDKDDHFEIRCGPHGSPDRELVSRGRIEDGRLVIEEVT